MESLAKQLARRIRTLRGDTPQFHYAKKLGISVASLNRLEQGQQNITLKTLDKLCMHLKCKVGDLFAEKPDTKPQRQK